MQFGKNMCSESHYTMTDCHGELKAGHKPRQWSGNIIHAMTLRSALKHTCRWQNWLNEKKLSLPSFPLIKHLPVHMYCLSCELHNQCSIRRDSRSS